MNKVPQFAWQQRRDYLKRNVFAELSEKLGYDKLYSTEEWAKIKRLSTPKQ